MFYAWCEYIQTFAGEEVLQVFWSFNSRQGSVYTTFATALFITVQFCTDTYRSVFQIVYQVDDFLSNDPDAIISRIDYVQDHEPCSFSALN